MIHHHAVAFKVKRARQNHGSTVCCDDWSTGGHAEIEAGVLALCFTPLKTRADPKTPEDFGLRRRLKTS